MASALDSRTRLDKWLWAARLYKSRTLAAQAIETGQARVNEERVKPANLLYREATESVALRENEIARRRAAASSAPQWPGRPTKRQRRKLQDFLDEA